MTTTAQHAAQTATAIRLDRDDTLCLRMVAGELQVFTGEHQWESTGHRSVTLYLSCLRRRGEDFARYLLLGEDGNATEVDG